MAQAARSTTDHDERPRASIGVQVELLRIYYDRLFPAELLAQWLSYGDDSADHTFFNRREFACEAGTFFNRYLSFKAAIPQISAQFLVSRCPLKIDIGPMYNVDPRKRSTFTGLGNGFYCVERELVFDIDMDEYDDVRTCCSEGNICQKDWAYMGAAILVMTASLRQDFGFEHILWVYSGRRGIHCWVCDKRARKLSDRERTAVAEFLSIYKGHQKGSAKLLFSNRAHPSVQRAVEICQEIWFKRVLPEQRLFQSEAHAAAIYEILGDHRIRNGVAEIPPRRDDEVNQHTWSVILKEVDKLRGKTMERKRYDELIRGLDRVILTHVYPRLDVMVSRTRNHLLKAPFCVHPKTGRICVPIDVENLWTFNPESVPTAGELYNELNENYHAHRENGVEGTALEPYIEHFRAFVQGMEQAVGNAKASQ